VTQREEHADTKHEAVTAPASYLGGVGAPLADSLVDLARLAEESPNPMLRIDSGGEILYANPVARELLGRNGTWTDQLVRHALEAMQSGQSVKCECVAQERAFVFAVCPSAPGRGANVYGVDHSLQMQAVGALRQSEQRLEQRVADRTRTLQETVARLGEMHNRQDLVSRLLKLFAERPHRGAYLRGVVEVLQEWSGLQCLGVRVVDASRNIPYEAYVGFTQDFWQSENMLNADCDRCICPRCIQCKPLLCEQPITTAGGSYCINDSNALIASLSPQERADFRGRCVVEGYYTIGAVAIRDGQTCLGMLHLADKRPNMLSLAFMEQLESMMPLVGGAIARLNQDEALHEQASLLELAQDAILVRSLSGQVLFWNRGAELTYGYSRDEALGSVCHELLQTRSPVPLEQILQQVTAHTPWEGELLQRTHDGKAICVFSRWVVQMGEAGEPRAILEISRDITARKQSEQELALHRQHLEELVENRTKALAAANTALQTQAYDLTRSNKDLEQFAYVASHDLQEPLRMVTSFMALLKARHGEQLPADALQYVDFAVDGALRMKDLIDGLLAYSRIGTHGGGLESVDMNAVIERARHNLRQSLHEAGAEISIEPLPTIHADPLQMLQLFQNLLGNAIKFHSPGRAPHVWITAEGHAREWVIRIRDNGIGIDPKYAPRVFTIFKRLHTREEYPGNGIGLAICKRIVDRHRGRIWLESTHGEGTTFLVSLPRMNEIAGE